MDCQMVAANYMAASNAVAQQVSAKGRFMFIDACTHMVKHSFSTTCSL